MSEGVAAGSSQKPSKVSEAIGSFAGFLHLEFNPWIVVSVILSRSKFPIATPGTEGRRPPTLEFTNIAVG